MRPTSSAPDAGGGAVVDIVLPTVFTDRSLGGIKVPGALRAAGLQVVTMAEHYGRDRSQTIADVQWIAEVAARGWIAFHQDARIRRRSAETAAVVASGARMFCVVNGNISGDEAAARYLDNLAAIAAATSNPGPFIYGVYADHIEQLRLS